MGSSKGPGGIPFQNSRPLSTGFQIVNIRNVKQGEGKDYMISASNFGFYCT